MKYNTKPTKTQIARAILLLIVALMIVGGIAFMLEDAAAQMDRWEPDRVYPMANTNISWDQTFHAGGWTEARP